LAAYIQRSLEPVLRRAAAEFPAVVLTGPRQSGKTTLLRHVFDGTRYVSLDLPDVARAAATDPRGFLAMYSPPVIYDEIQRAPELLPYIKERIDERRHQKGQFMLTGSANLLLSERVTESLAGRAAMLRLLPLSWREARGQPAWPLAWETEGTEPAPGVAPGILWERLLAGFYPELVADPGRDIALWHGSYVQTYLERDVRTLRQVGDLMQFHAFLASLAARSGQLLNLAALGRDLGLATNTVKAWLSVLEATYQVIVLRPYFANIGKRLVKAPKVYMADTGTLCHLVGLGDPAHAARGPMAGAILETAVVVEIVKRFLHRGTEPRLFFWRTSGGDEVDVVVEREGQLIPIEVKLSATPEPRMAGPITQFARDLAGSVLPGYCVHPGTVRLPLGRDVTALPFSEL
jgi:predicted AAA+ superfamily ATPase